MKKAYWKPNAIMFCTLFVTLFVGLTKGQDIPKTGCQIQYDEKSQQYQLFPKVSGTKPPCDVYFHDQQDGSQKLIGSCGGLNGDYYCIGEDGFKLKHQESGTTLIEVPASYEGKKGIFVTGRGESSSSCQWPPPGNKTLPPQSVNIGNGGTKTLPPQSENTGNGAGNTMLIAGLSTGGVLLVVIIVIIVIIVVRMRPVKRRSTEGEGCSKSKKLPDVTDKPLQRIEKGQGTTVSEKNSFQENENKAAGETDQFRAELEGLLAKRSSNKQERPDVAEKHFTAEETRFPGLAPVPYHRQGSEDSSLTGSDGSEQDNSDGSQTGLMPKTENPSKHNQSHVV